MVNLSVFLPVSLALIGCTHAAILYTRFPIDDNPTGWTSNLSNHPNSLNQTADQFSLSTSATIREIAWHGHMLLGPNNAPDTFLVRVFEDDNGLPAATHLTSTPVIANVQATSTTSTASPGTIFLYTATLELSIPGGNYWLSLVKTYPSLEQPSLWAWHESHLGPFQGGLARRMFGESDDWTFANAAERSFELRDTVTIPEPSQLCLGLLGIFPLFRRSRTDIPVFNRNKS